MRPSTRTKHLLQPKWSRHSGASIAYRFEAARPYLSGKAVLDLGSASGHGRKDWIHGLITSAADSTVGVDLNENSVNAARAGGYDLIRGDIETVRLDRRFDVVFAGELIEHLTNFRALFETARHHLRNDGVLILTTPNAFGFSNFVYRLGGKPSVNRDHTCWFCEDTLRQLINKCGFDVVEMKYLEHGSPNRARATVANAMRAVLPGRLAWNTLFAVARPVASSR